MTRRAFGASASSDDRFDGLELERGACDQRGEIGRSACQDTHTPFLKKGGRAGEAGDGVGAKLGGCGVSPEDGLFVVRTDHDRPGIHQLPHLSRTLHRGREDQHDVPHTSLDCQRVLVFAQ